MTDNKVAASGTLSGAEIFLLPPDNKNISSFVDVDI